MGFLSGTGFPVDWAVQWTKNHITSVWVVALLYVFVTLSASGRVIIKHKLLPHWYWMNGIFQSCLLIAFLPEVLMILSNGWKESVCRTGSLYSGFLSGTIMLLFVLSKVFDLTEALLILLEGRKPLPLHVFHHVVTLLFTWHNYVQQHSVGRWFVFVNLLSHVILYSYLSPKKLWLNPCWLSVCFTHIFQFIICLAVCFTAQNVLEKSGRCDIDADRLYLDKIVISIFFILFIDFYYKKFFKFRETHKYAWTVLRSERCIKSRQSSRRSEDLRPTQKIYTGWSPTGITPTDPNITN